jgi:hypothetical protein
MVGGGEQTMARGAGGLHPFGSFRLRDVLFGHGRLELAEVVCSEMRCSRSQVSKVDPGLFLFLPGGFLPVDAAN